MSGAAAPLRPCCVQQRNCPAVRHRAVSIEDRSGNASRSRDRGSCPPCPYRCRCAGGPAVGTPPMHSNSLTPMQISGTPRSFLNFGWPLSDIDSARVIGEKSGQSAASARGQINFGEPDVVVVSRRADRPSERRRRSARRRETTKRPNLSLCRNSLAGILDRTVR